MIAASQFKKGVVITFDGQPYSVEDYHIQKTAQRRPVLHSTSASRSGWVAAIRSSSSPIVSPSSGTVEVPDTYEGAAGMS